MDRQVQRDIHRKLKCLHFAQECGSIVLTCRKFGVSRSSFYRWKALYDGDRPIARGLIPVCNVRASISTLASAASENSRRPHIL